MYLLIISRDFRTYLWRSFFRISHLCKNLKDTKMYDDLSGIGRSTSILTKESKNSSPSPSLMIETGAWKLGIVPLPPMTPWISNIVSTLWKGAFSYALVGFHRYFTRQPPRVAFVGKRSDRRGPSPWDSSNIHHPLSLLAPWTTAPPSREIPRAACFATLLERCLIFAWFTRYL